MLHYLYANTIFAEPASCDWWSISKLSSHKPAYADSSLTVKKKIQHFRLLS